jgi:NAD(P)-dependent dehydrogenase (short-subunit alcohol dehydrogenase family)
MKTWFITGCSTGFGRDLATAALKRGHRVAVTARNRGENRRQFRVNAGKEAGDSERAAAVILDVVTPGDRRSGCRSATRPTGSSSTSTTSAPTSRVANR